MSVLRIVLITLALLGDTVRGKTCPSVSTSSCSENKNGSFSPSCDCTHDAAKRELCCDFRGKSGSISNNLVLFSLEVFVLNAHTLEFHPECAQEQNVTFVNIERGTFVKKLSLLPMKCSVNVHLISSSFESFMAIQGLTMVNSSVNTIAWAKDFEQFRVENSSVDILRNLSLENPLYRRTECFTASKSVIGKASHLRMLCDMVMDSSEVKLLQASVLFQSRITSSIFHNVTSNGLNLMRGWHKLKDVTFLHLAKDALIFRFESDVSMTNVSIVECLKPCIRIEGSMVYASGVTINGEPVPNFLSSDYVTMAQSQQYQVITSDDIMCNGKQRGQVECNLAKYRGLPLSFLPSLRYGEITVANHDDVGLVSSCYKILMFMNVLGYVREKGSFDASTVLHTKNGPSGAVQDTCRSSPYHHLSLKGSSLRFLHSDVLHGIFSGQSEIGSFEVEKPIHWVNIVNSYIHAIEHLEYTKKNIMFSSQFYIRNSIISSIYHLSLGSKTIITDSEIERKIVNFTVALHDPSDMVLIKNSVINEVLTNGISITRGVMAMDHVFIRHMRPGAITIGRRGTLKIDAPEHVPNFGCSDQGPSIIAPRRSQVVFIGAKRPAWLWSCIKILSNTTFAPDIEHHYVTLRPQICTDDKYTFGNYLSCNIADMTGAILGGNNYFDNQELLMVRSGRHLVVREHCINAIIIFSISLVTFENMENACYHQITLTSTGVDKIWGNVIAFIAVNSSIAELVPSVNVTKGTLYVSQVETMQMVIDEGSFKNVTLHTIEKLVIQGNLSVDNATFGNISTSSITVQANGVLNISQSFIKLLNIGSIIVHGKLEIKNTIIEKSFNESIIVFPNSFIHIRNVTIASNVPDLFIMGRNKNFVLGDLKINTADVHFYEMLKLVNIDSGSENSVSQNEQSGDQLPLNTSTIVKSEPTLSKPVTFENQSATSTVQSSTEAKVAGNTSPLSSPEVATGIGSSQTSLGRLDQGTSAPGEEAQPANTRSKAPSQARITKTKSTKLANVKHEEADSIPRVESLIFYCLIGVAALIFSVYLYTSCKQGNNEEVANHEATNFQTTRISTCTESPSGSGKRSNLEGLPQAAHPTPEQRTNPSCSRFTSANEPDDSSLIVRDTITLLT